MNANPVQSLTAAQREVLRMVMQRMTAKEMGLALGISAAAVEARLKGARHHLGVATSAEAARLLAVNEGASSYGQTVYGPSRVAPDTADGTIPPSPDEQAVRGSDAGPVEVREMQAPLTARASPPVERSEPLSRTGEERRGKTIERGGIAAAIDLAVKLAAVLALVCLAAILLSRVLH